MSDIEINFGPLLMSPGYAEQWGYPLETKALPPSWYVRVNGPTETRALHPAFATRSDAECALEGLKQAGLDTFTALRAYRDLHGRKAIARLMIESLCW